MSENDNKRPDLKIVGKGKIGAPCIELNEAQKQMGLELAAEGKSIKHIREKIGISADGMRHYFQRYPDYQKNFAAARQEGLEELADDLLDITEKEPDVLKARLKSENLRWVLSKRKPHVYGDRIDINMNATVDIRAALDEAKSRARPDVLLKKEDDDDIFS